MITQWRVQRLLSSFLNPNMGQQWTKHSGHPSTRHTKKTHGENLQKYQQRLDEAPFTRSLKGWGFSTMKYNSNSSNNNNNNNNNNIFNCKWVVT
jgi:hypothetical protein